MDDIIFSDLNGNKLLGTLSIPKNARSVVILSHGFTSGKDKKSYLELQEELNKAGIGTFRYSYYGYGPLYCTGLPYPLTKDITRRRCITNLISSDDSPTERFIY